MRKLLWRVGLEVDRETRRVALRRPVTRGEPSATDAAIIAAFTDHAVCTLHELDAQFEAKGLSRSAARVAISYSPLLRRVGRCLYSRIGLAPSPEDVEHASIRLREHVAASILDHFTGQDGKVHVVYRVSPHLGWRGLPVPPELVPSGKYRAAGAHASPHRPVVVRDGMVNGLRKAANAASRDGAERLALTFDLEARRVSWFSHGPSSLFA